MRIIKVLIFLFGNSRQLRIVKPPVKYKMSKEIVIAGNKNIKLKAKLSPAQCGLNPKICLYIPATHAMIKRTNANKVNLNKRLCFFTYFSPTTSIFRNHLYFKMSTPFKKDQTPKGWRMGGTTV